MYNNYNNNVLFFSIFFIPRENPEEQVNGDVFELIYKNYNDLNITSSKTPSNTRLLIETNSSGTLYTVDSGDPSELFKSTDKAENWSQPNGSFSLGGDLTAFFHDRTSSKLYFCTKASNEVAYVDLTDDTITSLGDPDPDPPLDVSQEVVDVFIVGSDVWTVVFGESTNAGGITGHVFLKYIDPNWVAQFSLMRPSSIPMILSPVIVNGTDFYFIRWSTSLNSLSVISADITLETAANINIPTTVSQRNIAYDGIDNLYFISEDTNDNLDYLYTYSFGDDAITQLGRYAIAFMQDRDTASGVQEKAFHITEPKIYQFHSQLLQQLHLIAILNITGKHIAAITDNFLMLEDD